MSASKTISISNPSMANAIYHALLPETRSTHEKRARTTITIKNSRLTITTQGNDPTYVKASQETYTKLIGYLQTLKI